MPVHLLDVNVLIALVWENHAHHGAAHRWFAAHSAQGWATCPITQCGFVRISANPRAVDQALFPAEAVDLLDQLTGRADHVFWPDDLPFTDRSLVPSDQLTGHQQVTDAYLLAIARHRGGHLATLDRGMQAVAPPDAGDVVVLIPA